jgi:hypothetical protein
MEFFPQLVLPGIALIVQKIKLYILTYEIWIILDRIKDQSAASFCHQLAALVQPVFQNFM